MMTRVVLALCFPTALAAMITTATRLSPRALVTSPRTVLLSMQETPFRSDDQYDYFRRPKQVVVSLPKPLGAVLEECAPSGVRIQELQEGGSGLETGLLKKGDRVRTVQGEDVSQSSFDAVSATVSRTHACPVRCNNGRLFACEQHGTGHGETG